MATKQKESTMRKELKATGSSNSQSTRKQTIARQNTPTSNEKEKPMPSGKPTPNYLRPTLSSRPEPLKNAKKTGNGDSNQKATLLRRRSFDRPPSASRIQTSSMSPDQKERPSSRDRIATMRSSSFTSKAAATSPIPVLDRNSKLVKPVKSQPPASPRTTTRTPSLSRSESLSKKSEKDIPISEEVPSSEEVTQTLVLETEQQSHQESLVPEAEIMVNAESEVQVPSASEMEDNKSMDALDTQVENAEDEELEPLDNCTASQEGIVSPQPQVEEETLVESHKEGIETQQQMEENHNNDEISNDHPREGTADEEKTEADQDIGDENVNEKSTEEFVEGKEVKEVDEGDNVSEEVKSNEGQSSQAAGAEVAKKPEAANAVQKQQGKKESQAYNDVIEQTKNKLLEKRKNKVKALVGAFETVIDYETAASK